MRAYSSTQPFYNLLSPPTNSRFAVHLSAISRSYETPPDESGHHNPNSPTCQDFHCHVFDNFLACPPIPCNDDLLPQEIWPRSHPLHHPTVTRKAAA